jgi:hypothetical protein
MIEGIFFLLELLAMLLLLMKIIKKPQMDGDGDLGIFDYIKERPQIEQPKPKGQQRA